MFTGFFCFLALIPRFTVLHTSICSGGYILPLHPPLHHYKKRLRLDLLEKLFQLLAGHDRP